MRRFFGRYGGLSVLLDAARAFLHPYSLETQQQAVWALTYLIQLGAGAAWRHDAFPLLLNYCANCCPCRLCVCAEDNQLRLMALGGKFIIKELLSRWPRQVSRQLRVTGRDVEGGPWGVYPMAWLAVACRKSFKGPMHLA